MGGLPVKPKLQGYVAQELFDEFERYRVTHNLNQSKGLEKLLAEFFNGSSASTLPQDEVVAAASLLAAMRAELADLRQELSQRIQIVEDRLAISSADGLVNESTTINEPALSAIDPVGNSADESATRLYGLATESAEIINAPIASDATTPLNDLAESAANLGDRLADSSVDESVMPLDESAIESAMVEDVSAISSADELATPLSELVARLADESAIESVEEEVEVEPATSEPQAEESARAVPTDLISATELAPLLAVTQPTVSRAAQKGNEKFRKWSSKQKGSAGVTWDFILVQTGGKQVPQFFQVTDTASV